MRKRGASANDSGIRPNLTNFFLKNRQPEFARGTGSFARTVALEPPQGHPRPARAQSSFSSKVRNRQSALILRKRQPTRSCALGLIGPARPALGQFARANMSDDERLIVREISSRRVNIRARSAWKDFQERPTTHSFGAGADSVSASFAASAGVIVNPGATERVARSERNQAPHSIYGASSGRWASVCGASRRFFRGCGGGHELAVFAQRFSRADDRDVAQPLGRLSACGQQRHGADGQESR